MNTVEELRRELQERIDYCDGNYGRVPHKGFLHLDHMAKRKEEAQRILRALEESAS